MAWVKGSPGFEVVLLRMEWLSSGRYSVRQRVESRGAASAARARGPRRCWSGLRMGKRVCIFAICSPLNRRYTCIRSASSGNAEKRGLRNRNPTGDGEEHGERKDADYLAWTLHGPDPDRERHQYPDRPIH